MKVAGYTGTRNLYEHMVTSIKSLLLHSNVDKIYLLIEDDEFPFELPDCVSTINVSGQKYFRQDGPNMKSHFTYMAMMRAVWALILPEHDRILSFDVDVIIDKDISELWEIELGDNYFAAVSEPDRCAGGIHYFSPVYTNIGVTMYNLKKLRSDNLLQNVIMNLNYKYYSFLEQDCFNEFCQGHILKLPNMYNCTNFCSYPFTDWCDDPKIIHYAGMPINRWINKPLVRKYADMPWNTVLDQWEKNCGNK